MEGTYLIRCSKLVGGRITKYHLDWGWSRKYQGVWTYSSSMGGKYEDKGEMLLEHIECLLFHFGLTGYKHNPKFKDLLGMSPAKLCALRRKREKKEGLERLDMQSNRVGDNAKAEDVT